MQGYLRLTFRGLFSGGLFFWGGGGVGAGGLLSEFYGVCLVVPTDKDECTDGNQICVSPAVCDNTVGSYTCRCPPYTVWDGISTCFGKTPLPNFN